jgi:hypothetical protein
MGTSTQPVDKQSFIAVSSDFRGLYKSDIYRVLAKPNDSIEHFRYNKNWIVDDNDCIVREKLIGKEVIIVFKHVSIGSDDKTEYIPIRKGVIIDFNYNEETEIYHYYFQLKEFCDINSNIEYIDQIFFSKISSLEVKKVIWKNRVEKLQKYFDSLIFYHVVGISNESNCFLKIKVDKYNQSYWYNFTHGQSYTLNLIVSNPNLSKNSFTIKPSSSDIDVVLTENYHVSAPFDTLKVPITTKSLDTFKERSFISFYLNDFEDKPIKEFENHIHIVKKMGIQKPLIFGLLSSVFIACTWLIKDRTNSIENIFTWKLNIDYYVTIYILLIILSSGILYYFFNKK